MKKYILTFCMILISVCGVMLSACGENYNSFSLHFSSPSIEIEQNTSQDYEIVVENYFKSNLSVANLILFSFTTKYITFFRHTQPMAFTQP